MKSSHLCAKRVAAGRSQARIWGEPLLVIAIMLVLSVIATFIALVAASPLFRTITLALDSWSERLQIGAQPIR